MAGVRISEGLCKDSRERDDNAASNGNWFTEFAG